MSIFGGHEEIFNGVVTFKMHLDAQTIAGLLEPFTKAFCVGYYNGNVFVVGTTVVGVVMLVTIDSLCIVDVVPVVIFCTIEGPWGKLQASRAYLNVFNFLL